MSYSRILFLVLSVIMIFSEKTYGDPCLTKRSNSLCLPKVDCEPCNYKSSSYEDPYLAYASDDPFFDLYMSKRTDGLPKPNIYCECYDYNDPFYYIARFDFSEPSDYRDPEFCRNPCVCCDWLRCLDGDKACCRLSHPDTFVTSCDPRCGGGYFPPLYFHQCIP